MAKSDFYVVINGEEVSSEMSAEEAAEYIFDMVASNEHTSFVLGNSVQHGRGEVTTITCV